jgi:hypothetical protein
VRQLAASGGNTHQVQLLLNLKTAKALGLRVSGEMQFIADEAIE